MIADCELFGAVKDQFYSRLKMKNGHLTLIIRFFFSFDFGRLAQSQLKIKFHEWNDILFSHFLLEKYWLRVSEIKTYQIQITVHSHSISISKLLILDSAWFEIQLTKLLFLSRIGFRRLWMTCTKEINEKLFCYSLKYSRINISIL